MAEANNTPILPSPHHTRDVERHRRALRLALAILAAAPIVLGSVASDAAGLGKGGVGGAGSGSGKSASKVGSSRPSNGGIANKHGQAGTQGTNQVTNSGKKGNHYGGSDPSKGGSVKAGPGGGAGPLR